MKFENTAVWGFEHALRGMRNPMNSWDKSDSELKIINMNEILIGCVPEWEFVIGKNDLSLAQRLITAGPEHRKFLRQIIISVDITAPLYWWKEFETYKIGTVANSCSTMHKITSQPITLNCFEIDDYTPSLDMAVMDDDFAEVDDIDFYMKDMLANLETLRQLYLKTKDKRYWKELIRWLPESWLQKRTVTMNYENIYSMIRQRKNHKLTEWSESFINWTHSLPYANELLFYNMETKI